MIDKKIEDGIISTEESSLDNVFSGAVFPLAMKVAATTIGQDLVEVKPMGGGNNSEEMKKIHSELKTENRDRKIESIVEDKEFKEMTVEEHPDYKKPEGPRMSLMYFDFIYDDKSKKK